MCFAFAFVKGLGLHDDPRQTCNKILSGLQQAASPHEKPGKAPASSAEVWYSSYVTNCSVFAWWQMSSLQLLTA